MTKLVPIQHDPAATHKDYLGDGVYVRIDDCGMIWLTTENGIAVLNEIALEPATWDALLEWRLRSYLADQPVKQDTEDTLYDKRQQAEKDR